MTSDWHKHPLAHVDWSKSSSNEDGGYHHVPGVVRKGRRPNPGDPVRFQDAKADVEGMGKVITREGDHVLIRVTWTFMSALDGTS